jgi:ADP-ribose pyrophosphatase YjhB (NUDIX family)
MNTKEAIVYLEQQIADPSKGLPEEIFLFITRLTPMVNVDLLIKDEKGRTLLAWRKDEFHPSAWHVPGGIIRFKEDMKQRIEKVIESEIGLPVQFDPTPLAIHQIICQQDTRGHFISLLIKCFLSSDYPLNKDGLQENDNGYLRWHDSCPDNLLLHDLYRRFI